MAVTVIHRSPRLADSADDEASAPRIGRRQLLGWAATGGAAFVAAQAASSSAAHASTTLPVTGATIYSVVDFGAVGDGQTDDTAGVQAAVNAAGAAGGGTIFWPSGCFTRLTKAITVPSRGAFGFIGAGATASAYCVNDAYPASGIMLSGDLGSQPTTTANGARWQYVFDLSAAASKKVTVRFADLLVYLVSGGRRPTCLACIPAQVYRVHVERLALQNVSVAYTWFRDWTGDQTQLFSVKDCEIVGAGVWAEASPFLGEISGCQVSLTGVGGLNPMPDAEFLKVCGFWSWWIHHNLFSRQGTGTADSAVLHYSEISQTTNGTIDHNNFYGSSGRCIYIKDDCQSTIGNVTGGLVIADNEFSDWNHDNIAGSTGSGVLIDHSTASSPDQIITIGKNTWIGGANSLLGLEIVDNPDTAAVVFDRDQNMRFIQTAPYRIAGVNYGTAGASHRFQANLTAPAVPGSNKPLANPFGFDATVYLAHGTVNAVAINGVPTGLTSGVFRLPRDATITLTYKAAPSWTWFTD